MDGENEPKWLTPQELHGWKALMAVLLSLQTPLDAQLRRDSEMTLYEYLVLAALSDQQSRTIGMKQLAALTNGSMSRLSHVVKRMEDRGWVVRRPNPTDGRLTDAILTDAGLEKIVSAAPGHVANARDLVVDVLTESEMQQLGVISEKIARRVLGSEIYDGIE